MKQVKARAWCQECNFEKEFSIRCSSVEKEYGVNLLKQEQARILHRKEKRDCRGNVLVLPPLGEKSPNPAQ